MTEIVSSLHAAWRLFRLDAEAVARFDLTAGGFWRSFVAVPFALIFYLPFSVVEAQRGGVGVVRHVVPEVTGFALSWLAAVLILLGVAILLKCTDRYAAAVIAWNWVAAVGTVLLAAAHLMAFALPPFALAAVITAIGYVLWVKYFVVRTVLELPPVIAAVAVAATMSATILINLATTPLT